MANNVYSPLSSHNFPIELSINSAPTNGLVLNIKLHRLEWRLPIFHEPESPSATDLEAFNTCIQGRQLLLQAPHALFQRRVGRLHGGRPRIGHLQTAVCGR